MRAQRDAHPAPLPHNARRLLPHSDARAAAVKTQTVRLRTRLDTAARHKWHEPVTTTRSEAHWDPGHPTSAQPFHYPTPKPRSLRGSQRPPPNHQFSPPTSTAVLPYPYGGHHDAPENEMTHLTPTSAPLHQHPAKAQQGTSQCTSRLHSIFPALALALALALAHNHHQPSEHFALIEANNAPQHIANTQ